jgi:hypothetical protein
MKLCNYSFDTTTFLKLSAANKLPAEFHLVWLQHYINKYSLLRSDIIRFIEFLANNPRDVQLAIQCLSINDRKRLVRYLRSLRNYSPSCHVLFYSANKLELVGYDTYNLTAWMSLQLNPLPLYSKKGFVTRNWAVLQLKLHNFKPNWGNWTIQRTLNYKSYLACKLERLYYRWNPTVDDINCMYDGNPKLFQAPLLTSGSKFDSTSYFYHKFSSKLKDKNLKIKICNTCGYKLDRITYRDKTWVDKALSIYDSTYSDSISLLKQEIRTINDLINVDTKTFTPAIDYSH